ncbi:MAG TPA: hypothetical protein VLS91_07325 [Acidimicrobiales bacterium]|nr:hypothetical protein [Acidimicrobiales bacterium]
MIVSGVVALALEPILTIHIVAGLLFVGLVVVHLVQRRRTSRVLARRVLQAEAVLSRSGRLALSDALLLVATSVMFASGLWDWYAGHATRIRYHAISGVLLGVIALVHTWRRRRRLRSSLVR